MKAKTLKQLISQIPDEEEVYYSEYDKYSEEWEENDEFRVKKYRNPSGEIVSVICGPKPDFFKEECEFQRDKSWKKILESFPQKKNWEIEKTQGNYTAIVRFKIGFFGFQQAFIVIEKDGKIQRKHNHIENYNNWEDFFAAAEPVVIKAAQKQREELESLLVD